MKNAAIYIYFRISVPEMSSISKITWITGDSPTAMCIHTDIFTIFLGMPNIYFMWSIVDGKQQNRKKKSAIYYIVSTRCYICAVITTIERRWHEAKEKNCTRQ